MTTPDGALAPSTAAFPAAVARRPVLSEIRLLVVSDETLQGFAMKTLLESLGLVATFAESVARARRMMVGRHEIVVWVADRFDGDALREAETLWARQQDIGFCLVASAVDARILRELLEHDAARFAFVGRRRNPTANDLLEALERVAGARGMLDGSALRRILSGAGNPDRTLERLSAAEREVLVLLSQGLRNCEIARQLWKSEKTVEKHIGKLFEKLELNSDTQPGIDRRVSAARIFLTQSPIS
jgi:DNA-binding NarL/FixJ family response regulator